MTLERLTIDGQEQLALVAGRQRLSVDFTRGAYRFRHQQDKRIRQPLARAVAPQSLRRQLGRLPRILDGTAGLGADAWFMAALGAEVLMVERHPLLHALLADALERACADTGDESSRAIASRIELRPGDVTDSPGLAALAAREAIDVIHLDPMNPSMRRRGASAKGMQFLHALLGDVPPAGDSETLFAAAFASAVRRIVIKRPRVATVPEITQGHWQYNPIASGGTRLDVFVNPGALSHESSGTAAAARVRLP